MSRTESTGAAGAAQGAADFVRSASPLEHEAETAYLDAMAQFGADSAETFVAKRHLEVVRRFTSTHEWYTHQ
jgi:hypothetical protein